MEGDLGAGAMRPPTHGPASITAIVADANAPTDFPSLTWTFGRGRDDRLELRRVTQLRLDVRSTLEPERQHDFGDADERLTFETRFRKLLLAAGWTQIAFSPERRKGGDRRAAARGRRDRRITA